VIGPVAGPLTDNTQNSRETPIHEPGGTRTRSPKELAAAGLGSYTIYNQLSNILIIIMDYIKYQRLTSITFILHVTHSLSYTKSKYI